MFATQEGSHREIEYKILVILCLVIMYLRESFSKGKQFSTSAMIFCKTEQGKYTFFEMRLHSKF